MLSCVQYKDLKFFFFFTWKTVSISEKGGSLVAATRMITMAPIHIDTGNNAALNVASNLKICNTVIAAREYNSQTEITPLKGDQRLFLAYPQLRHFCNTAAVRPVGTIASEKCMRIHFTSCLQFCVTM